jgi:shikimate kinase
MGAGKTSTGKKLAKALNCPFVDTDKLISNQEGCTISQLFETKGENYFRTLEQQVIEKLDANEVMVVATGGGLPCHNNLMDLLSQKGTTVYLQTKPSTLLLRLKEGKSKRPLIAKLNDDELAALIDKMLSAREEIYLKAELVLSEAEQKVENIILRLHQYQKNS